MNSLCVVLMLMWLSNGLVTSSAIPINIQAGMSLGIEGLDLLRGENEENIQLRMALELSSGDQRTPPKALVENIQEDDSKAATTTPRPTTTTTTTISPYTPKECKNSLIRLGDQCYYFSATSMKWLNALSYCSYVGADLVHPMSAEENSHITTHLKNNFHGNLRWWIGGTDKYEEGQWVWAHDNSPMTYTNWVPFEPTNDKSYDCAYYQQTMGYKWNDDDCTNKNRFICQQRDLNVSRPLSRARRESTKDIDDLMQS